MKEGGTIARRKLVGSALALGASAVVFGVDSAVPANAQAIEEKEDVPAIAEGADSDAQYGFLMRVDHCVNCGECVAACRLHSHTPDDEDSRRRIVSYTTDSGKKVTISSSCMHCEDPACLHVCPAGAISKGAGGIVVVDKDRCIGCKYCYQACPHGVPRYGDGGMDKCDYCFEAGVALGERTYCVRACHVDALLCGKVDELISKYPDAKRIEGPAGASCYLSSGRLL